MDEIGAAIALHSAKKALEAEGVNPDAKVSQAALRAHLDSVVGSIGGLAKRIATLEKQAAGLQKKLDHADAHALKFMGQWAPERAFYAGNLVRHADHVYTALRDTAPGGQPPNRHGSPWALIV